MQLTPQRTEHNPENAREWRYIFIPHLVNTEFQEELIAQRKALIRSINR